MWYVFWLLRGLFIDLLIMGCFFNKWTLYILSLISYNKKKFLKTNMNLTMIQVGLRGEEII